MPKLRPSRVKDKLIDIFEVHDIKIIISETGGNFQINLPGDLEPVDIHDISVLMILRYSNIFKIISYDEAIKSAHDIIRKGIQERVETFLSTHEKEMIQCLGSSIDKNKKPLFKEQNKYESAVALKFSKLNISGQSAILKKLGLGVEFKTKDQKLVEIVIHKFGSKHK